MKLTVVRHGETLGNINRTLDGQLPGELTENGKNQAQATADKLSSHKFDAIYCSDLQRCRDTADYIRSHHPEAEFSLTSELRERSNGIEQGKKFDIKYWESLPGTNITRKYPEGESWEDVKERLRPFINSVFEKHSSDNVLIVSHGGPIRGLISLINNINLDELHAGEIENASITILEMTKKV